MRKINNPFIIFLIFICLSGNAMPLEKYWDKSDFSAYADFENSKRIGDKVLFWILNDYHVKKVNAAGQEFKSDKILFEIDCKNKTRKVLQIFLYSLPMGKGEVIYSNSAVNDLGGAIPEEGKVGYRTWELACSLK